MLRILAILTLLLPLVASGCSTTQPIDFNPATIGSGQALTPLSGSDDTRGRR